MKSTLAAAGAGDGGCCSIGVCSPLVVIVVAVVAVLVSVPDALECAGDVGGSIDDFNGVAGVQTAAGWDAIRPSLGVGNPTLHKVLALALLGATPSAPAALVSSIAGFEVVAVLLVPWGRGELARRFFLLGGSTLAELPGVAGLGGEKYLRSNASRYFL